MNPRCFMVQTLTTTGLLLSLMVLFAGSVAAQDNFVRADSDGSGDVDFNDAINTLSDLFLGTGEISCEDAADADDSSKIDFNDAIYTLEFLFLGSQMIPAPNVCGDDPTADSLSCADYPLCEPIGLSQRQRIGHLLNRIAYGPTIADVELVTELGIDSYIQQQLDPRNIPENPELLTQLDELTSERLPSNDSFLVRKQAAWRYMKGTQAPPTGSPNDWRNKDFDDSGWLLGVTSIGYGDNDDTTELLDMAGPGGYLTVFLRHKFVVKDVAEIDDLILHINYDDGFVCYLNGFTVANRNVGSTLFNSPASDSHEAQEHEDIDISRHKLRLVNGENVIAVQLHNRSSDSSDATIDPALISRTVTSQVPIVEYRSIEDVKASVHMRGIYSSRRLQVVLADFWENHFTTDHEKMREYFDELTASDGTDAMSTGQAERESANLEAREYEFFLENALGNFSDLLRFSATSPTMLVYLDNVLNFKANPNENYSREIKELHTFGVDNGYTQTDIEEGARIFTGWNICKVHPDNRDDPHAPCGVQVLDTPFATLGPGWKYFKGTRNPTETGPGQPTTEWTEIGFDDTLWLNGSAGFGYGDNDDTTILHDMQNNYLSVYVRREFEIPDLTAFITELENLVFEVEYDDGFVAYLNGVEIARSETMEDDGSPPNYDAQSGQHEVDEGVEIFNLMGLQSILVEGTNVFSAQAHNRTIDSSDLSFLPRLVNRESLPGSIEPGDVNGVWTTHFLPDEHDYGSKILFAGRPYQLRIPARNQNDPALGVLGGHELIDQLVNAAPTAEFICSKLVQKLVSDSIPEALVATAIAAWNSTNPKGNIATVVEAILTSDDFFNPDYYRDKVKDPLEFVNSSTRALEASTNGYEIVGSMREMGMHVFTRSDPDGWPEVGYDWATAGGTLNRILFAQDLAENSDNDLLWQTLNFLKDNNIETAEEIVRFFNDLLFDGTLSDNQTKMLVQFVETNNSYVPLILNSSAFDYDDRVQKLISLMLSLPQWNFQ